MCLVQPFSHSEEPADGSRVKMGIEILQRNIRRFPDAASKTIFQVSCPIVSGNHYYVIIISTITILTNNIITIIIITSLYS